MDNKHYIRLDSSNRVIKGFSDAFEAPLDTDICINEQGGRQFELLGVINPPLINMDMTYKYKYANGEILETTEKETQIELASFPKPEPSQTEEQKQILDLQKTIIDMQIKLNGGF